MAILVQPAVSGSDTFNTTLGVTLSGVTLGSSLLTVWVVQTSQPTGVTDSGGGSFGNTTTGTGGNGFLVGSSWLFGAAAGSHTVTITVGSSQSLRLWLFEVSAFSAFDVASAIANGFSSSAASASQAPSAAGETAIGLIHMADPSATLSGWGSSLTQESQKFENNHSVTLAALSSAGAGAISASATASTAVGWGAWIQFVSPASSGSAGLTWLPVMQSRRRKSVIAVPSGLTPPAT